eukprot:CAMPEP_0204827482 /NCGR_PEP_ID=MMETSP1346-20131115/4933_1 /ASSEMBLY_ACC=CAM_ASM_000771 /TAXON_ID=215587 /ORGANISM="Aplanochytrium stocchinoi, Strain GSBS06" /LENGTH=145 /DNA_ID=CAMNT_0051955925 /DNA_START=111 /DNA_END=545 /DNA_ORIENTATION=-
MQGDNTWSVLAGSALNHWRANKYAESVELLKKLREQLETNPNAVSASTPSESAAEKSSGESTGVADSEMSNQSNEQTLLMTEAKIKHNIPLADFAARNDANINNDSYSADIDNDLVDLLKKLGQVEESIRNTTKVLGEKQESKEK